MKYYHSMHSKLGKFGSEENPTFFYVTGWKKSQIKQLARFCKWVSGKVLQQQFYSLLAQKTEILCHQCARIDWSIYGA